MRSASLARIALTLAFLVLIWPAESIAGNPPAAPTVSAHAFPPSAAPDSAVTTQPSTVKARRFPIKVPTPSDSVLVDLLRRGNYVLLFRHAATDWGQRDADLVNYADRAAQRNLSDIGRAQSDSIGKAVKALGLKIGKVHSSPMFRCRDTAEIAFGRADTTIHLFVKSKTSRDVRVKWLSTPLADGALLVLVTHQDPFIPLFKFQRDQLKEGDALLIQQNGSDKWKLLAQIAPADWARLAANFGK